MEKSVEATASALRVSLSLLARRLRQVPPEGAPGLTMPQRSALARLELHGPTTSAALARVEQISPQSMGTTLASLEALGLVERQPDPVDGRRVVMSVNRAGRRVLRDRRDARVRQLARLLSDEFDEAERELLAQAAPLLERLGHRL